MTLHIGGSVKQSPVPLLRADHVSHPERAIKRRELVRVRRGIYAPADAWRSLTPWDAYLARVHAVAMTNPDPVFSHESAAALRGLPIFRDPGVVHVIAPPSANARTAAGVRTHTTNIDRALSIASGMTMTAAIETVVDIARTRHPAIAIAVGDAALRADRSLSAEGLAECNESRASSRGRRTARIALRSVDGRAGSALESVSRVTIRWLGFPEPELQRRFRRHPIGEDRCDFWWEPQRVAGEADGDLKYDGTFGDPVEALAARRQRDARLLKHARSVQHWAWSDVASIAPLRAILLGTGLPLVAPEETAVLASLRRALSDPR